MLWVDTVILVIVAISAFISLLRGMVREVLSLIAWVAAFWGAKTYHPAVAEMLVNKISLPSARWFLAYGLLFVGTLFALGVVNFLIGRLVAITGLSGTDRMLGIIFGVARGVAICTLLVLLATFTPLPKDPWWGHSIFIPHLQVLALWLRGQIPPELTHYFNF